MAVLKNLPLALLLGLAACGGPSVPTIEGTTFAAALDVQLSNSTKLPSGTYYRDLVAGSGAAIANGQTISAHYTLWLPDGTKLESNVGGAAYSFPLGAGHVIPGWDLGLVGAHVGGTRQLIIPPDQAYGAYGQGAVPANAILV